MPLRKRPVDAIPRVVQRQEWMRSDGKETGPTKMAAGETDSASQMEASQSTPFNSEYLRRLRARDPEIEEHFDGYFRERLRFKLSICRVQEDDKRDIINETLLRVLRAVYKDAIHSPERFGGYVNSVCENVLSEIYRYIGRHSHDQNVDDINLRDPAESAETRVLRNEKRRLVKKVLDGLRPKDRRLLHMKVCDDLSSEEMMARFGANTPGHVRLLLHRALKAFAKAYKNSRLDSR